MKIIMDSLVPNHKKKQLMPERIMEPPDGWKEAKKRRKKQLIPHYAKLLFEAKHR